jgi:hypothetical protein
MARLKMSVALVAFPALVLAIRLNPQSPGMSTGIE